MSKRLQPVVSQLRPQVQSTTRREGGNDVTLQDSSFVSALRSRTTQNSLLQEMHPPVWQLRHDWAWKLQNNTYRLQALRSRRFNLSGICLQHSAQSERHLSRLSICLSVESFLFHLRAHPRLARKLTADCAILTPDLQSLAAISIYRICRRFQTCQSPPQVHLQM